MSSSAADLFVSVKKKKKGYLHSGLSVSYLLFLVWLPTAVLTNQHFSEFICLAFRAKVNLRRHRETFSLPTFESDISLTFQTCHNSPTDKIIGALIDNTNNWDLQSDFFPASLNPERLRTRRRQDLHGFALMSTKKTNKKKNQTAPQACKLTC